MASTDKIEKVVRSAKADPKTMSGRVAQARSAAVALARTNLNPIEEMVELYHGLKSERNDLPPEKRLPSARLMAEILMYLTSMTFVRAADESDAARDNDPSPLVVVKLSGSEGE